MDMQIDFQDEMYHTCLDERDVNRRRGSRWSWTKCAYRHVGPCVLLKLERAVYLEAVVAVSFVIAAEVLTR